MKQIHVGNAIKTKTKAIGLGWAVIVASTILSSVTGFHLAYPLVLCWGVLGSFVLRRNILVGAFDPARSIPRVSIWALAGLLVAWPLARKIYRSE
jgi:hypothetical protein